jgi:hypothetical protein
LPCDGVCIGFKVPNVLCACSWETVKLAQGSTVTRPVVRLELGGRPVYITRIQPHIRNTSMLIRCDRHAAAATGGHLQAVASSAVQ